MQRVSARTIPREVAVSLVDAVEERRSRDDEGQGQRDLQQRSIEKDIAHGARSYMRIPPSTERVCPVM